MDLHSFGFSIYRLHIVMIVPGKYTGLASRCLHSFEFKVVALDYLPTKAREQYPNDGLRSKPTNHSATVGAHGPVLIKSIYQTTLNIHLRPTAINNHANTLSLQK